jgi:hypothetical protein
MSCPDEPRILVLHYGEPVRAAARTGCWTFRCLAAEQANAAQWSVQQRIVLVRSVRGVTEETGITERPLSEVCRLKAKC